jgi:hypothetical protein
MKRSDLRNYVASSIESIEREDYESARDTLLRVLSEIGLKGRVAMARKFYLIRTWPENDSRTVIGPFTKKRTLVEANSWEGKGFDVAVVGATDAVEKQMELWTKGLDFSDPSAIVAATVHDLTKLETKHREAEPEGQTKKAARRTRSKK